jgi:hypothetical protein
MENFQNSLSQLNGIITKLEINTGGEVIQSETKQPQPVTVEQVVV